MSPLEKELHRLKFRFLADPSSVALESIVQAAQTVERVRCLQIARSAREYWGSERQTEVSGFVVGALDDLIKKMETAT